METLFERQLDIRESKKFDYIRKEYMPVLMQTMADELNGRLDIGVLGKWEITRPRDSLAGFILEGRFLRTVNPDLPVSANVRIDFYFRDPEVQPISDIIEILKIHAYIDDENYSSYILIPKGYLSSNNPKKNARILVNAPDLQKGLLEIAKAVKEIYYPFIYRTREELF